MRAGDLLLTIIEDLEPRLRSLEVDTLVTKEGKWTAKQILGHLIDSACNNHRRFVSAPAMDNLLFDGYDQEKWVEVQNYAAEPWVDIVRLWYAYNRHLAHVMNAIPEEIRYAVHEKHNLDRIGMRPVPAFTPTTLEYLMCDYIWHIEHHIQQIFPDYERKFHW